QGMGQAIGVVDALGVSGDLLADDAGGIGIVLRATHAAHTAIGEQIDIKRADGRAVMRADGADGALGDGSVHGGKLEDAWPCDNRIMVMGWITWGYGPPVAPMGLPLAREADRLQAANARVAV